PTCVTRIDSSSDPDEELPVIDFLQRKDRSQPVKEPVIVDLEESDVEDVPAADRVQGSGGPGRADVMMVSSDSDDDTPYVPLALRLKQRQGNVISAPSAVSSGTDAQKNLSNCSQNTFPEPELLPSCTQLRSGICGASLGSEEGQDEAHPGLSSKPFCSAGSDDNSPAKKRHARRTAEEVQASREEAMRRRQAREQKQRDREALKLEQEKQKAERKALAEAAKAMRPEECIKHMVVAVDPALLQLEGGGALLSTLQDLGCSCAIEKQTVPRSVGWLRRTTCTAQVTVGSLTSPLIHVRFLVMKPESSPSLTSWVEDQQKRNPGKILSLVIIDVETYFRSQKIPNQKKSRGKTERKGKSSSSETLPEVSRVEVEEALVHLQLHTGVSVRFLSTWKDFADHIAMTTKAVAEAPFKRQRAETVFSFHLDTEWCGGQRVERSGQGLLQVWRRQVQQLNRVSADVASAVVAAYPSPQLLNKAYSRCQSEREKMLLLSDLLIRRGEGLTSTTRKVGPELSKRLYLVMNSCDPEQSLEAT
uniref:Essential meiotic structure-specific endonuclease 1 n=1 Tax=Cynoglossus semilaevis TaxID=244447 RepID=A0A3P8UVU9_CYNSE